jgi:tetratricopeptide (TPR) repeat protein
MINCIEERGLMESKIKITSGKGNEFYKKFQLGNETYEAVTEDLGARKAQIITRIYLKGEIRSTTTSGYADQAKLSDNSPNLRAMMEKQHKSAVETFISEQSELQAKPPTKPQKSKAEYAEAIRLDLKSNKKTALGTAREALEKFPDDPFFLSYCGYLTAIVEGKSREGAGMCEAAITILRKSKSTDIAFFLPLFYLHLGKVYMKADRKQPAINAFQEGLKFDSRNRELLSELKAIGSRKSPVIPFLGRSNPINKFLGKLRHDLQKRK